VGGLHSGVKATRKLTLEDSWALSAHEVVSRLGFGGNAAPFSFNVSYVVPGAGIPMSLTLRAEPSGPYFGGLRWWWRYSCGRRVSALFLPSVCATEFRCRPCHALTYRSSQRHDSRVDYYRRHPDAALESLCNASLPVGKLFLILRRFQPREHRGGIQAAGIVRVSIGTA